MKQRKIFFYKDYFQEFFVKQRPKVQDKIIWTFELIEDLQTVPETYLKHLENSKGLYEIRIQSANDIFRIFYFFDQGESNRFSKWLSKEDSEDPKK
jgi:phage-related protein